jgi:hypothetical protein
VNVFGVGMANLNSGFNGFFILAGGVRRDGK